MTDLTELKEQLREKIINVARLSRDGICHVGPWYGDCEGNISIFPPGPCEGILAPLEDDYVRVFLSIEFTPVEPIHPLEALSKAAEE